jgi:long-chain acyl-CoA synthetase
MQAESENSEIYSVAVVGEIFKRTAERFAENRCQWYQPDRKKPAVTASFRYKDVLMRVEELSAGLKALGLCPQDRVAVMSLNNFKGLWCNLAIMESGAVCVNIHPAAKINEVKYILHHSESRMIFINDNDIGMMMALLDELPLIEKIIIISDSDLPLPDEKFITINHVFAQEKHYPADSHSTCPPFFNKVKPADPAVIVYSSKSSGKPVNTTYTHQDMIDVICCESSFFKRNGLTVGENDILLSFLPPASLAERLAQFHMLFSGGTIAYLDLSASLLRDFNIYHPTWFSAAPEYFERIFLAMQAAYSWMPEGKAMFQIAIETGLEALAYRKDLPNATDENLSDEFKEKLQWADESIFSRFKLLFGDRFRFSVCTAPGLSSDLADIYAAMGIKILPGSMGQS